MSTSGICIQSTSFYEDSDNGSMLSDIWKRREGLEKEGGTLPIHQMTLQKYFWTTLCFKTF